MLFIRLIVWCQLKRLICLNDICIDRIWTMKSNNSYRYTSLISIFHTDVPRLLLMPNLGIIKISHFAPFEYNLMSRKEMNSYLDLKIELDRKKWLFVKNFFANLYSSPRCFKKDQSMEIYRISSEKLDEENILKNERILLFESSNYPLWDLQQIIWTDFFVVKKGHKYVFLLCII